jgi:hypothetical protein
MLTEHLHGDGYAELGQLLADAQVDEIHGFLAERAYSLTATSPANASPTPTVSTRRGTWAGSSTARSTSPGASATS